MSRHISNGSVCRTRNEIEPMKNCFKNLLRQKDSETKKKIKCSSTKLLPIQISLKEDEEDVWDNSWETKIKQEFRVKDKVRSAEKRKTSLKMIELKGVVT